MQIKLKDVVGSDIIWYNSWMTIRGVSRLFDVCYRNLARLASQNAHSIDLYEKNFSYRSIFVTNNLNARKQDEENFEYLDFIGIYYNHIVMF